jgi:hypothetical protein
MNAAILRRGLRRTAMMMLTAAAVSLVTQSHVSASGCSVPEPEVAASLFDDWNAALKTQHPDRMTRLFANDGALRGFASPISRNGYMPIRDYFLYFLQFEPKARVTARSVETGCNFLIDQGNYVWTLKSRTTGAIETREARFHFIYEMSGGRWRISQFVDDLVGGTQVAGFSVPPPLVPRVAIIVGPAGTAVAGFVRRGSPAPKQSLVTRTKAATKAPPAGDLLDEPRQTLPQSRSRGRGGVPKIDTDPLPTFEQLYFNNK